MLFRIGIVALCLLTPTVAWAGDSTIRRVFVPDEEPGVDHSNYVAGHSNGANCVAGQAARGVTAAGAAELCFDVFDQVEADAHIADESAHHTPHLSISLYTADASSYQTNRDGTACFLVPAAATLQSCLCFSGDAGESLNMLEKSAGSDAGSQMLTTGTCDNAGADDSLTITDAAISAGSLICLDVEGTPDAVFAWLGCEAIYD